MYHQHPTRRLTRTFRPYCMDIVSSAAVEEVTSDEPEDDEAQQGDLYHRCIVAEAALLDVGELSRRIVKHGGG